MKNNGLNAVEKSGLLYSDMAIIFFVIVAMLIFTYIMCLGKKYGRQSTDIEKTAIRICNNWLRASLIFITVHYMCVLCSIFSTLIVLHISCFENTMENAVKFRIVFLSILAIFTNICPFVIDFKKMSKCYREAFIILDNAILTNITNKQDLANAITDGEKKISPII